MNWGFLNLAKKSFAVISTSLGILSGEEAKAFQQPVEINNGLDNLNIETFQKRFLKPKLVLKINADDPGNYLLAQHSSHSSHSSHRSHASHYSGSSGSSSDGGNGLGIVGIGIAGVIGYGLYQAGKKSKK